MTGIDAPYEAPPRNAPGSYRLRTPLRRGAGRPAPTAVEPARPARMRPKMQAPVVAFRPHGMGTYVRRWKACRRKRSPCKHITY
jgi:hypothetical protein